MTGTRYDVAIVGGSLAGSAAATFYGRAGLKVALVERQPDLNAYKRLCTTVIQASAVPTIQRLGLDKPIEAAGGVKTGLALWTRWGWALDAESSEGYDIRREKLDPMIRSMAAETPGVDYLPGRTVIGVLREGGRVSGVETRTSEGETAQIHARLVVGADGRNSEVAKLAGVGARIIKKHQRAGYYAFFKNVQFPHPRRAHLWMLEPDVAFAFPHDNGFSILAVMFGRERVPEFKTDIQGNFLAMLRSVPEFARFDPADQATKVIGLVDYKNQWRHRPPPGLAFVGDAAISADPLFGIGCGWALQEAEWLTDATAGTFGTDADLDKAVDRYCDTLRAKLAGHFFLISDYSTGRKFNPIEKLTFSSAARDPEAAHLLAEFGARLIPPTRLLAPHSIGHALKVNLGPAGKAGAATAKRNAEVLRQRSSAPGFGPAPDRQPDRQPVPQLAAEPGIAKAKSEVEA